MYAIWLVSAIIEKFPTLTPNPVVWDHLKSDVTKLHSHCWWWEQAGVLQVLFSFHVSSSRATSIDNNVSSSCWRSLAGTSRGKKFLKKFCLLYYLVWWSDLSVGLSWVTIVLSDQTSSLASLLPLWIYDLVKTNITSSLLPPPSSLCLAIFQY